MSISCEGMKTKQGACKECYPSEGCSCWVVICTSSALQYCTVLKLYLLIEVLSPGCYSLVTITTSSYQKYGISQSEFIRIDELTNGERERLYIILLISFALEGSFHAQQICVTDIIEIKRYFIIYCSHKRYLWVIVV